MGNACCKPESVNFDGEVNLFHFFLLRSVGKGAFGKVRVVQHKQTKTLFALKYINKAKCVKMKAVANVVQERRLLEEIDHPFVVNLRYAFQDDENCFFVLDLMLGGDLRFHLDRAGSMPEETVRFYMCELALAIDHLHERRIVHRDLKPDNILLDEKGHVHLTDFNIAVHFSDRRLLTGVAGSLAYMAPEVLTKKGYSAPVDWWSLGVVAYELVFGKRPFRGKSNSQLTDAILKEQLKWPEAAADMCSQEGLKAIRGFVERDPNNRLGYRSDGCGLDDIKAHPWFAGVNWDVVYRKEAIPPFVPDAKKANFDATHELEELLLEENPLKARKRNPNTELDSLSKEMRTMEEHFTIFDYTKRVRRSHYTGPEASARAVNHLAPSLSPPKMTSTHSSTPSERGQYNSSTGLDIEGQIANGGGIAALRGQPEDEEAAKGQDLGVEGNGHGTSSAHSDGKDTGMSYPPQRR